MHLDLSWCTQITDKGILTLSQYQPQLLSLNLSTPPPMKTAASRSPIPQWDGSAPPWPTSNISISVSLP